MSKDVTAIIATLFMPPTFEPLIDAFRKDGARTIAIHGKRTNEAWMEGLAKAKTRYVMIVNDDIEIYPKRGFVGRMLAHHAKGYTHLLPTMWRSLNGVSPTGEAMNMGPGWAQPKPLMEMHAMDKGHFISMDRSVEIPPIPDDLTVFYGDDWFYWQHMRVGRCGVATDVQVRTGADLDRNGFDGTSGWSQRHALIDRAMGEPFEDVCVREHKLAPKYFSFYRDEPMQELQGWYGFSRGLRTLEGMLSDVHKHEPSMIPAVKEAIGRLHKHKGSLDCVVDMGANVGSFAIAAAMRGAKRVVAIEPDFETYDALVQNVERYGLSDVIECWPEAVGAETAESVPFRRESYSGVSSLIPRPGPDGAASAVSCLSLLDAITRVGEAIDYCKIDVEGAEHLFMLPNEDTFAAFKKIRILDMEWHGPDDHSLFADDALTPEMMERTRAVLDSLGVPEQKYVAHGTVSVPAEVA